MAMRWLVLMTLALAASPLAAEDHETSPAAPTASEVNLLITAFGPFDGRGINGSSTVLPDLVQAFNGQALVLPVTWASLHDQLTPAIASMRPRILIGLGEGHPGAIALELRARNQARGKDVAAHSPPPWLGPSMELWRPSRLPESHIQMLARLKALPEGSYPINASQDAGDYLCNAWLWHALGSQSPIVCFIHLPPQGERSEQEYRQAVLPGLITLLEQIISDSKNR
ncbi:MAG: hypothetical protein EA402_03595 [Planctomycetota bacterium]|nr:MAG: hypothetical protein EA402_03595 [Planctomycetota bacterium]